MANNLSALQRAAFSGGSYDLELFRRVGRLTNDDDVDLDVSEFINSWGETKIEAFNLTPKNQGEFEFPFAIWSLKNEDGFFSPGAPGCIWGSQAIAEFFMDFEVLDLLTDPSGGTKLVTMRLSVSEVQLVDDEAHIMGIVELARWWAYQWQVEDRLDMFWIGYNNEFILP